jgi:hypothetical protein
MEKPYDQNLANHGRIIPGYHYVVFSIFAVNLLWSLYRLRHFSFDSVLSALLAVAFLLLFYYARVFALRVQDRVIRLEMILRLGQALPPDLRSRLNEFTLDQLIALRFAGDDELPDLARRVLSENLTDRKAIKKMIRHWKPDFLRA